MGVVSALEQALSGQPWSVGSVVRGLDPVLDDEGRPLGERRAPSAAKQGVPIVLRGCPYHDERKGVPMNVSALAQVTRHQERVLAELSAFVAHTDGAGWTGALEAVVHLLSAPALSLLSERDAGAVIRAEHAVGHKLAAGFYGVVRDLVARDALGAPVPVTADAMCAVVRAERALFGASEVCAGAPNMLVRATRVLLGEERVGEGGQPTPVARAVASALTRQVLAGLAWELVDRVAAHALLHRDPGHAHMRPRNHFMAARLDEHVSALADAATGAARPLAVPQLGELLREPSLRSAFALALPPIDDPDVCVVLGLFEHGDQAVELDQPCARQQVARTCVGMLRTYASLLRYQWEQEMALRAALGFSPAASVHFDPSVLQRGRCALLFEALSGHRIHTEPGPAPQITLRNHKRAVSFQVSLSEVAQPALAAVSAG